MKQLSKNGFTYIELAIVLSIVSVLVGVTLVWTASNIQFQNYVQRLVSDIRYAQFYAISQNEPVRLNFSPHEYSLTKLDGITPINFPSRNDYVMRLEENTFLSDLGLPFHYIIFDGKGVPYIDSHTNPWISLSSDASLTLTTEQESDTLYITPETGKIRL